jgi:hypothetical protein
LAIHVILSVNFAIVFNFYVFQFLGDDTMNRQNAENCTPLFLCNRGDRDSEEKEDGEGDRDEDGEGDGDGEGDVEI